MKHDANFAIDWLLLKAVDENKPELAALAQELADAREGVDKYCTHERLRECGMVLWQRAEKWKNALKEIQGSSSDFLAKSTATKALKHGH